DYYCSAWDHSLSAVLF
nr:immunoglobulin light chain junction region [Macaca mulatta]MOV97181.1 immunoglobulin light chain junction region [Macaca mulatta]MOV98077.1 immunoglobulin light chain junction region [Macaca mulatta]MOW00859.1 immunoglobulin light chain junction region [Macaca mulatta]MOW01281.1 immunoglobulin light chain junction region [Macaca mulatta]